MDNYLQELFINEAKPALKRYSRGSGSSGDGVDVGTLLDFIEGDTTELRCPALKKICEYMFYNKDATHITLVDLPNATSIGDHAFHNCIGLKTICIPNAITIGNSAFCYCSITSVNLPQATTIGNYAFEGCSDLTSIDLPNATTIGEEAFIRCDVLTTVILRSETLCDMPLSAVYRTKIFPSDLVLTGEGSIYVPSELYDEYVTDLVPKAIATASLFGETIDEATATGIVQILLRKIEDYPEICNPAN